MRRFTTILSIVMVVTFPGGSGSIAGEPRPPSGVELTLRLRSAQTRVGELVYLEETIPAPADVEVGKARHHAVRIGRYDGRTGRLVNLSSKEFEPVLSALEDDLGDLLTDLSFVHGMAYTINTIHQKGGTFEFRPKCPGIYLLTVEWQLRANGEWISGAPVVLSVRPKLAPVKTP